MKDESQYLRKKFIMQMTGDEFLRLMEMGMQGRAPEAGRERRTARGAQELADSVGCSRAQVYAFRRRLGASFSEAVIDRFGRRYIYDVDKFIAMVRAL